MTVNAGRRIRTARLRGGSEQLIRRGALLLEDALRTASLPDATRERVLLIRSLSLGVICPDKSAARVALQLEQQVAKLVGRAVHGADLRAATAQVVYFHDRLDAVVTLVQRLAQGVSGDGGRAWYWRSAVPGWQSEATPQQAGRLLLGALLNLEAGSQAMAQAFQRLVESHSMDLLLHAVREQDGSVLLQRCGWGDSSSIADDAQAGSAAPGSMPLPRVWQAVLVRWVTRWGASDARSRWLAAWVVQSWRPELVERSAVLREALVVLRTVVSSTVRPFAARFSEGLSYGQVAVDASGVAPAAESTSASDGHQGDECAPLSTSYAGFLFLIPLLVRVGFGRAIQDHPEWVDSQVAQRLLHSLAGRLSIPPDDPVHGWLLEGLDGGFREIDQEDDGALANRLEPIVAEWRMVMRRWCRIQAQLGFCTVVQRPGWVSITKTHVDVWMPLSGVDVRIRRAGLDLDPGWVPWLSRVFRFHYDAEGRSHGAGGIHGD